MLLSATPGEAVPSHRHFDKAREVLRQAIARRAFPGAAFAVAERGQLAAVGAEGRFRYEPDAPAVASDTVFDLASLTKPLATTTAVAICCERNLLALEQPVGELLPEFVRDDRRRQHVTLDMLLAHSSGLPAYAKLFQRHSAAEWEAMPLASRRQRMLEIAAAVPLVAEPGTRAEYSDIGFILLGAIVERVTGSALDASSSRDIFRPLGMSSCGFRHWSAGVPPASDRGERMPRAATIPPTLDDRHFRHRVVQGEVHDENAWAMGGVAGHAGLFGNVADVARFAIVMLAGSGGILQSATVARFTQRRQQPAGTSRALGWDTPSAPSQSGRHFGARAFGHLGYTGTSLWIDPERDVAVVLLTNRTWPDAANNAIKEVRPAFHDAVMKEIL
jgi:CubicO group peptidase (beta-lactamase class C family)